MRHPESSPLRLFAPLLAVCLAAPAAAAGDGPVPIGRVKTVAGQAAIVSGDAPRAALPGVPVYLHDVVETGSDGSVGIVFADESRLALGPDTRLTVDEFVYRPEAGAGSFLTRMVRGSLLYVSGLIAKVSPDAARVETPAGTLGIRGTRFLLTLVREPAP
jgi:hypothetical protein